MAPRRGEIVRIRDERWTVCETTAYADATVVTVQGCDRFNHHVRTRYLLPFEPFERLPSVASTRVVSRRRWRHLARSVLAYAVPAPDALRAAAAADMTVFAYQLEPALAMVAGIASRILIADEVGLGKTIQAGLIIAETLARRADARVLVLCPAGLRQQWREELSARFGLDPVVLDSASVRHSQPLDEANPWALHGLALTSIDYIKRPEVIRAVEALVWDLLVIDEAHGIGGHSDRHAVAALLAQRARTLVMLTATPHSGDEDAFARLTEAGGFDGAFPLLAFRRTRADVDMATERRTRWLPVRPTALERQMHRALLSYTQHVWRRPASPAARLAMIILARRACSSASSLARSIQRRLALLGSERTAESQLGLPLDLPDADEEPTAHLGAPGLTDPQDERRLLERILALARAAAADESKMHALKRFLQRAGEPAIVFTEYRDTLAVLSRTLGGFSTCELHGGLTAAERIDVLKHFSSGAKPILLATDAASEGLNLQQRCRLVVHLEVPWTPSRIEQRVGRVDRIGQTRVVHQLHLVAAGSIEDSYVAEVARRSIRVARVLNALSHRSVDDRQTASCAIGGDPLPAGSDSARLPTGIITADLKRRATDEAARLLTTRQLLRATGAAQSSIDRPFAAAGPRTTAGSGYAAFWFEFVDSDAQFVCEALAGAEVAGVRGRRRSAADVRRLIHQLWSAIQDHVVVSHTALAAVVTESMRQPLASAVRREEAIAYGAKKRHARMAMDFVQRGLFDRRSEREAAAQRELCDRVVAQCLAHIGELERRRVVAAGRIRPAFSLIT